MFEFEIKTNIQTNRNKMLSILWGIETLLIKKPLLKQENATKQQKPRLILLTNLRFGYFWKTQIKMSTDIHVH